MSSKWIRTTAAAAAIVLAGSITACGSDDTSSGGSGSDQTVKVGGIFDLSGATADVGTPYADGIKGFVKDYDRQGDGPKIELTSEDYKYDVAVAERLYSRLKSDGVVAIQGWGTGDTEALRVKITADRLPFMSASYAETLTKPSDTPFNFVVATSYSDQMRIALKWIDEQSSGAQVASFHHDSPFGESPQKAGAQTAKQLHLGFQSYAMPAEATDYVPQLRRAQSQGAKFVVIQNVATPAAQLAKNIAEQKLDMKVVCLNWCGDELFVDLAGKAAAGTVGVMPWAPASVKADGLAQPRTYLSKSGGSLDKQGLHYVQGWYTMALMAEGIKRAAGKGKVTGESIKQALEQMDAFDTGGVSAPVDFTATSHAGMKGSKLYVVKDGKWSALTKLENAS
ncbi:MAG: branched-chain amino acid transport system substrate-binding protein [Solirubrobacteraceae bacterium]|nr:branched-chain amino acid transport system substrate-binding protein [Solirubrobacteraceae bacterium]